MFSYAKMKGIPQMDSNTLQSVYLLNFSRFYSKTIFQANEVAVSFETLIFQNTVDIFGFNSSKKEHLYILSAKFYIRAMHDYLLRKNEQYHTIDEVKCK